MLEGMLKRVHVRDSCDTCAQLLFTYPLKCKLSEGQFPLVVKEKTYLTLDLCDLHVLVHVQLVKHTRYVLHVHNVHYKAMYYWGERERAPL